MTSLTVLPTKDSSSPPISRPSRAVGQSILLHSHRKKRIDKPANRMVMPPTIGHAAPGSRSSHPSCIAQMAKRRGVMSPMAFIAPVKMSGGGPAPPRTTIKNQSMTPRA